MTDPVYVSVIAPRDRAHLDSLRAEVESINAVMLADPSSYDHIEALAWEISTLAHRMITMARMAKPMAEWRDSN